VCVVSPLCLCCEPNVMIFVTASVFNGIVVWRKRDELRTIRCGLFQCFEYFRRFKNFTVVGNVYGLRFIFVGGIRELDGANFVWVRWFDYTVNDDSLY